MSHRTTAPSPPQLTFAYQNATWTTGPGQVLKLVGANLSTSGEVDVDSFATVTDKSYAAISGTSGVLTITLDIASLPAGAINIPVSNGGQKAQGDLVTNGSIEANPTWSPEALIGDEAVDWYWQSTDMTGYSDGDTVLSIEPGVGERGAMPTHATNHVQKYKSSRVNGEPALWGKYHNSYHSGTIYLPGVYEFDLAQPYTLAIAWRPVDESNVIQTSTWGTQLYVLLGSTSTDGLQATARVGGWYNLRAGGTSSYDPPESQPYPTVTHKSILVSDGTDVRLKDSALITDDPITHGGATTTWGTNSKIQPRSNCDIYSIVFLERAITDTEIALLESYWSNRYS